MSITINKDKVTSIFNLLFLGLYVFFAAQDFKGGTWTWGLLMAVLAALQVYGIYKRWAWKPKTEAGEGDQNKTKDLKKVWKDKMDD